KFIYIISIRFYSLIVRIVSLWNPKAKQWISGRKNWQRKLEVGTKSMKNVFWFHCASLGEFEQARPLIEKIKKQSPEVSILLSFFSPSGYELRKDYPIADYVCYLPIDTKKNAKEFLSIVKIEKVFFVKYEVWAEFFKEMKNKEIPFYLISATFRSSQIYFKNSGKWFLNLLKLPTHIFVQEDASKMLLQKHKVDSTIAGDTRFDKVFENAKKATPIKKIEEFTRGKFTLLAGSSWEKEEKMISEFLKNHKEEMKIIFAPHDVSDSHVKGIFNQIGNEIKALKFSEITKDTKLENWNVLVIDNIGMLSNLYQYATVAFVGGGFKNALHNILEPATFGIPVLYGSDNLKFPEAKEMAEKGGGIEVLNQQNFNEIVLKLISDKAELNSKSMLNKSFIQSRIGATELIYNQTC
ncbi:3-deoxy-D-manno-octulosonic acid transferase, partial [bacterium]|nr:3-deoxy-D-manno-octulosonic acid transferase [bacterium]